MDGFEPQPPDLLAEDVIRVFGGLAALARALGHRHASTVFGWQKSGRIPRWRLPEIVAAANRLNIKLPGDPGDEARRQSAGAP